MALGAQRSRLFFEVLRRVLVTAAVGVAVGLAGSIAFSRVLGTYLYSIEPEDSMAYVIVLPILLAAILAAGVLPAIRASRLDPLEGAAVRVRRFESVFGRYAPRTAHLFI